MPHIDSTPSGQPRPAAPTSPPLTREAPVSIATAALASRPSRRSGSTSTKVKTQSRSGRARRTAGLYSRRQPRLRAHCRLRGRYSTLHVGLSQPRNLHSASLAPGFAGSPDPANGTADAQPVSCTSGQGRRRNSRRVRTGSTRFRSLAGPSTRRLGVPRYPLEKPKGRSTNTPATREMTRSPICCQARAVQRRTLPHRGDTASTGPLVATIRPPVG